MKLYLPILGAMLALSSIMFVPSAMAAGANLSLGDSLAVDNSLSIHAGDFYTNPNPQVDDPAVLQELGITTAMLASCDMLIPEPGDDGGGDPPADPPSGDGGDDSGGSGGGGTDSSDFRVCLY